MSIATYSDLQAAIADYLKRADLTSRIPDFITQAEAHFNRKLRVRDMERAVVLTLAGGGANLPTDYLEWLAVTWAGVRIIDLRYVEPDTEEWQRRYRPGGDPTMFTTLAGSLVVRPIGAGAVALIYYQIIPPLASNAVNWLLTKAPDLYLSASLAQAAQFMRDDEQMAALSERRDAELAVLDGSADSNKVTRRPQRQAEVMANAQARSPATGVI